MCGLCAIMHKKAGSEGLAPIGRELVDMLDSLAHRGIDSSGVTICGEEFPADYIIRLWYEGEQDPEAQMARVEDIVSEHGGSVVASALTGSYLRTEIRYGGDVGRLAEAILKLQGMHLHSIGRNSEIIKDVGTASDMDGKHSIDGIMGTHGIGHVRMATESRVDINHSHPFWAYPFPDVSVVHNGQLTNYHKLTRKYEDEGYTFQTENDSELIAVYLADKMYKGMKLDDALHSAVDDLDGTFTFVASTEAGIGYAKDRWSAKPMVATETDDMVAIASEEIALRRIFPNEIDRAEPQEGDVKTWLI